MAKYPELEGVPSQCLNTSPLTSDSLKIRAPYGNVDKAEILQPGIISLDWPNIDGISSWDLFNKFLQGKDQDALRGVGWSSNAELDAGQRLLHLANELINKKDTYEPAARSQIVALAQGAKDQLQFISSEYAAWAEIGWAGKSGIVKLWLKASNEDIAKNLKDDHGGIWASQRTDSRKQIRAAWDKAIAFLWCAVYGANQSKVYLKNKELAIGAGSTITAGKIIPKRAVKKVVLIPTTSEPDFVPGRALPPEEEIVPVPEEKPRKKKGVGILVAGAAAVALLAMKK